MSFLRPVGVGWGAMLRGAILVAASLLVLLLGAIGSAAPGEKKATVVAQENSGSYVGSAACARCHSAIYRSYVQTAMGRSMTPAEPDRLPNLSLPAQFSNEKLDRRFDVFTRDGKLYESEYALAADSTETFRDTRPVKWMIGAGINGFGPVVEQDHYLFQGPLSFY